MRSKFNLGAIFLKKFSFSGGEKANKRPVLVINDFLEVEMIFCRITSQFYSS